MTNDATSIAAASVVRVIRRALNQTSDTPEDQRLSFRHLCEVSLPLLEQLVSHAEDIDKEGE